MTSGEPVRSSATRAVASWRRFDSTGPCIGPDNGRYLGCKQNLGHPVNDLFDLRTDGRPHENQGESAPVKTSDPVDKASRQGIECRHGGSEHDQRVCDSTQLSLPKRTDMV